jgi:hypothetical protein
MKLLSGTVLQNATRLTVKLVVVAAATVGGGALVSSSVFASLSAEATGATSVAAGTMKWEQATATGGGFATVITAAAPGDTFNRYVNITNSGSLDGITPTVSVVPTGGTALSAILKVYIQRCSIAWTGANCTGGTPSDVLGTSGSPVAISTLSTTALSNLLTTSAAVNYLKISLIVGPVTEVTTNGVIPSGIQGASNGTSLAWTFALAQRTGVVTEG